MNVAILECWCKQNHWGTARPFDVSSFQLGPGLGWGLLRSTYPAEARRANSPAAAGPWGARM